MNVIEKIKLAFCSEAVRADSSRKQANLAVVSASGELVRARSKLPNWSPASLNGRWAVEAPWKGDECDWWNPFTEADGKTELTFTTAAEANSYLYSHKLEDCRVVQVQRWVFPGT